jgi:hypothetical protein
MSERLNIKKGERFGRLKIIKEIESFIFANNQPGRRFLCQCDCGKQKKIKLCHLRASAIQSCGCLQKERTSKRTKKIMTKHGMSGSNIYEVWNSMKMRCHNKKDHAYKNYGGRGIKVCKEWLESFESFYKDMGNVPKDLTLDRINNNKGYYKENCRWATMREQANNRRTNHLMTYKGKTQNMKQWAVEVGIKYETLLRRINNYNWSIEEALTTKIRIYEK